MTIKHSLILNIKKNIYFTTLSTNILQIYIIYYKIFYYILLNSTDCTNQNSYSCNNKLKINFTFKYLCIEMSHNLKQIELINSLFTEIRKFPYIFKILRSILNKYQNKTVRYYSESTLTHDIITWGVANNSNLNKLQITQYNILRIILNKTCDNHIKIV